jgi:hypothetical protein
MKDNTKAIAAKAVAVASSNERQAERYIENCKKFDVTIDPSVVIALKTGWSIMKPTMRSREGCMLPLMDILAENDHVSEINLSNQRGDGNSNARVLNEILQANKTVSRLDLSSSGLGDEGLKELCLGLQKVTRLQRVFHASAAIHLLLLVF